MKKIIILVLLLGVAGLLYLYRENQEQKSDPATSEEIIYTSDVFTFYCPNDASFTIQYNDAADKARLSLSGAQYQLDRVSAASGARYVGSDNEAEFWEHQGEVRVRLGADAAEMVCQDTPQDEDALIVVDNPSSGETVSDPVELSGKARGYWFFEGSAPVMVTNWDGLIIGEGYITAGGDWMTEDYVSFSGSVDYELPIDTYSASGTVIFQKSNPSGLPEHDAAVEVPVILTPQS